ncbi:MAG: DUF445 domain-containing protein [Chitinophagaceae bacterium]
MTGIQKAQQLRKHKQLATALFLAMALLYVAMVWLGKYQASTWIGFVKSFAEAAMVGALADWFAITALFHHPLGLPIPHTNLIEKRKQSIGDNLGDFVVKNFLTPTTIRPYIDKLKLSTFLANWLTASKHKELVIKEVFIMAQDILDKLDDAVVARFLARKAERLKDSVHLNKMASQLGHYLLAQGEQQQVITAIAKSVKEYVSHNEELVREKVKGESYFFIPGFVEDKLAAKITAGLERYFEEVELETNHRLRGEISRQLALFFDDLGTTEKWDIFFKDILDNLLSAEKLEGFASAVWTTMKASIKAELSNTDSGLAKYLSNMLDEQVAMLQTDTVLQEKIDSWIRQTAYKLVLRNADTVGTLISTTVGNWQGKDLSEKLELEVGKDLQFIRINGTIVGGLVGLLIHTLTILFG